MRNQLGGVELFKSSCGPQTPKWCDIVCLCEWCVSECGCGPCWVLDHSEWSEGGGCQSEIKAAGVQKVKLARHLVQPFLSLYKEFLKHLGLLGNVNLNSSNLYSRGQFSTSCFYNVTGLNWMQCFFFLWHFKVLRISGLLLKMCHLIILNVEKQTESKRDPACWFTPQRLTSDLKEEPGTSPGPPTAHTAPAAWVVIG